jgi:hypothetical protein
MTLCCICPLVCRSCGRWTWRLVNIHYWAWDPERLLCHVFMLASLVPALPPSNHPTTQLTNQLYFQPAIYFTNHTNQPTYHSNSQLTFQTSNQPTGQSIAQTTHVPVPPACPLALLQLPHACRAAFLRMAYGGSSCRCCGRMVPPRTAPRPRGRREDLGPFCKEGSRCKACIADAAA